MSRDIVIIGKQEGTPDAARFRVRVRGKFETVATFGPYRNSLDCTLTRLDLDTFMRKLGYIVKLEKNAERGGRNL